VQILKYANVQIVGSVITQEPGFLICRSAYPHICT
jgi:hypothetical protein